MLNFRKSYYKTYGGSSSTLSRQLLAIRSKSKKKLLNECEGERSYLKLVFR